MVEVETLCETIKRVFIKLGKSGAPFDAKHFETVLDDAIKRYLLQSVGDDPQRELVRCIAQVDVVEGKAVVIVNKMFPPINEYLYDAGIPKDQVTVATNHPPAPSALAS